MRVLQKFLLAIVVSTLASCLDSSGVCELDYTSFDAGQVNIDATIIDQYLQDNNIIADIHESGLRYVIHQAGDGSSFDGCANFEVTYTGMLLDGTIFDSTKSGTTFEGNLLNVLVGWRLGIPLIKPGGSITLYIPSPYAYGPEDLFDGNDLVIPKNSPVIYDIDLISVF